MKPNRGRTPPAVVLVLSLGLLVYLPVPRQAAAQTRAPTLRISPNAIQKRDVPMIAHLTGAPGQTLYGFILRNCDRNPATPELRSTGACTSPLWTSTVTLDGHGRKRWSLKFSDLPPLPDNENLWLRVSASKSGVRHYQDAVFGFVGDSCGLVDAFRDLFGGRRCKTGVRVALGPRRVTEDLPDEPLEVRRAAIVSGGGAPATTAVPGTHGATGAAWQGSGALIVTIRRPYGEGLLAPDPSSVSKPGLYRVDLATGKRTLLLAAPDKVTFLAPLVLRDGVIAFFEQSDITAKDGTVGRLVMWKQGRIVRAMPLRHIVFQLIAADKQGRSILALGAWQGASALLRIDTVAPALADLGFDGRLYHAAMLAPGGGLSAIAQPDNANQDGWDIVLMDDNGRWLGDVAVGPGDDLLPAWRPDGKELAYIAQVGQR